LQATTSVLSADPSTVAWLSDIAISVNSFHTQQSPKPRKDSHLSSLGRRLARAPAPAAALVLTNSHNHQGPPPSGHSCTLLAFSSQLHSGTGPGPARAVVRYYSPHQTLIFMQHDIISGQIIASVIISDSSPVYNFDVSTKISTQRTQRAEGKELFLYSCSNSNEIE
jgi:hypothetical protein